MSQDSPRSEREIAEIALACLDLTDLGEDTDLAANLALAERAKRHRPAAVCVWPRFVAPVAQALADSPVKVATVVNFPTGQESVGDVVAMTRQAVADGTDEIDVVLPYRSFLGSEEGVAEGLLDAVRAAAGNLDVKVIIESGELREPEAIAAAARLAIAHGAQFVKTSTGKSPVSATPEAAEAILAVIASLGDAVEPVGFKASGGIRTVADARTYIELADAAMGPEWVGPATFRFGASGLLNDILRVLGQDDGEGPAGAAPGGY